MKELYSLCCSSCSGTAGYASSSSDDFQSYPNFISTVLYPRGTQKKLSYTMLFFAFKASENPSPLLPISEMITKLSKTLITFLRYILPL